MIRGNRNIGLELQVKVICRMDNVVHTEGQI